MELKNKLSFGAISIDHLLEEYFDRDKILGYCKACPDYEKNWSCPPYQFDEKLFLKQFKYMHLIGRQYPVPKNDIRKIRDPQEISNYCTEKTQVMKVMTWKTLLEIEAEVEGAIGLIPGNCPICKTQGMECTRKIDKPCRFPNLMRYSLESLGFNVADLIKYEVGMNMKWPENQRLPEQLTAVAAILCNEEIPQEILKKYFPDKKKSWVKYDATQLDTQFKTSVAIKPAETIHGRRETTRIDRIDEEIPAYTPHKSWINYKAEPDEELKKKPQTIKVTVQGEDALKMPFESKALESYERPEPLKEDEAFEDDEQVLKIPKADQESQDSLATKEEVTIPAEDKKAKELLATEDESQEEPADAEEQKYKWLGFKAKVEDEDLPRRPIPKMSELIPDEEKELEIDRENNQEIKAEALEDGLQEDLEEKELLEEAVVEEVQQEDPVEAVRIVKKTSPSLEKTISDLVQAASSPEAEESEKKYKWLGFKGKLDEES